MSVNSTVARTRSGVTGSRTPVDLADLGHDVVAIGPRGMMGAGQFNVFGVANMAGVFYVAHDSATDTTD
jgi:hypothetical protein